MRVKGFAYFDGRSLECAHFHFLTNTERNFIFFLFIYGNEVIYLCIGFNFGLSRILAEVLVLVLV